MKVQLFLPECLANMRSILCFPGPVSAFRLVPTATAFQASPEIDTDLDCRARLGL